METLKEKKPLNISIQMELQQQAMQALQENNREIERLALAQEVLRAARPLLYKQLDCAHDEGFNVIADLGISIEACSKCGIARAY